MFFYSEQDQQQAPPIVTDGLVLHLDAGDTNSYPGTGNTWYDLSANGNNTTLFNSPTFSNYYGGEINFDGVNDYAEKSSPNLGMTGDVSATLSCWFYDTNTLTSSDQALLVYGNGINAGDVIAIILKDLSFSVAYNGGQNVFISNNLYSLNSWNNAVITKTPGPANTTTKLYLNGVEKTITSSTSIVPNVSSRIVRISRWAYESVPIYLKGKVSSALIYNRALSQEEITQNFNATKSRFGL